jgi:hypothetical protein
MYGWCVPLSSAVFDSTSSCPQPTCPRPRSKGAALHHGSCACVNSQRVGGCCRPFPLWLLACGPVVKVRVCCIHAVITRTPEHYMIGRSTYKKVLRQRVENASAPSRTVISLLFPPSTISYLSLISLTDVTKVPISSH